MNLKVLFLREYVVNKALLDEPACVWTFGHLEVLVSRSKHLVRIEVEAERQRFFRSGSSLAPEHARFPAEHHDGMALVLARNCQQRSVRAEAHLKIIRCGSPSFNDETYVDAALRKHNPLRILKTFSISASFPLWTHA